MSIVRIIIDYWCDLLLTGRMEWPALLVPVWLDGMETRVTSIPTTAVLTRVNTAYVRYVLT